MKSVFFAIIATELLATAFAALACALQTAITNDPFVNGANSFLWVIDRLSKVTFGLQKTGLWLSFIRDDEEICWQPPVELRQTG